MIKEIPFQYDLDNPVVELKFQSELSKIVKHYDTLTVAEEAEAVKCLLGNINIPNVFNWIPIEMATGCDIPIPVTTVDDFRFVLMACFEDARRSRARTISYRWAVIGTPKIHHGDMMDLSKRKIKPIQPNPAIKHLVFQRLMLLYANSAAKTTTLMPIAALEPLSSLTIKTILISVRRPMVG